MAKDPAFLFYPGDYLRDTQILGEKSQVAYDRIICEHMRNICISKSQLKFFTKKLSEDELEELLFVLTEIEGGYQVEWVADSISKRKAYSESRRNNRSNKKVKDINNISKTYVHHMENEIENEIVNKEENTNGKKEDRKLVFPFDSKKFKDSWGLWKDYRAENGKKKYKPIGEQGALTELSNLSNGDEKVALAIIMQTIKKGWTGFYNLKNNNNGNTDLQSAAANLANKYLNEEQ